MRKRFYSTIGIIMLFIVLFVNCYFLNDNAISITDTEVPLAGAEDVFNMLDFNSWKQGDYSFRTGSYNKLSTRICMMDCPEVEPGQQYKANINDAQVHILIREMDGNGKLVISRDLVDGKTFDISDNTKFIKIGMYVSGNAQQMSFEKYKELFVNGLKTYLTTDSVLVSNDNTESEKVDEIIEENTIVNKEESSNDNQNQIISQEDVFGMSSFDNWRSGNYSYTSGNFTNNRTRICLNDYVNVTPNQTYVVAVSNTNYHILIREIDANSKLIKSHNLSDKDKYTVSASCVKIGISIYDTKSKTTSFNMYKTLFENGFKATLTLECGTQEDIIEVEEEIPVYGSSNNQNSSSDVTDVVYPDVKSEIIAMIQNGDTTTHDVSKYHMKWLDVNSIFNSVIENECLLEYECAYGIWISFEKDGDYAKGIKMNGIDDTYADCLSKSKERIASVMAGIDDSMTDLDKALYCYDNIVINSKYSKADAKCYYGGNVLAYNTGACAGISSAYRLLLRAVGINSSYVQSSSMQHGWAMVEIDGKWYHADPTWDNTRYRYSNVVSRHYFMRNDSEYSGGTCIKKHYNWKVDGGYTSTSTKYTDWIVHDITVPMTYEKGYWKYTDSKTGHLMKIKLDGSDIIDLSM